MNNQAILEAIDHQIAQLQQARALLVGVSLEPKRGPGRPKGSPNNVTPITSGKREMSPEARKRIGDAVRRRWAKAKKAKKYSVAVA